MACPDRDNDLRILGEIALRKLQRQKDTAMMEDPAGATYEHHWEGSLLDIQYMGIPLDRVESIHRQGDNRYVARIAGAS